MITAAVVRSFRVFFTRFASRCCGSTLLAATSGIMLTPVSNPDVAPRWKQSDVGQQLLHRLDFPLLALGDGFSQLDGGRMLTLSDLGLCQGDRALMVPNHAL